MLVFMTPFRLPKAGNTDDEYEDAFYPVSGGDLRGESLRFAVADGASEGMLSGEWAQVLVKAFCRSANEDFASFLDRSYNGWEKGKCAYLLS